MVEGAAYKCMKYLLFAFNVLFVILGLLLIVTGAVVQAFVAGPLTEAIFIIIIGGIIFIVAFFGCCGAIKENRCMLITFGVFLVVIMLLCIIGTIVIFVYKNKAKETAHDVFKSYITDYEEDGKVAEVTDTFQQDNKCCGILNYTDWHLNEHFNQTDSVPKSCCKNVTENCGDGALSNPGQINTEGCLDHMQALLEKAALIIGAVAAATALVMIIGVILACCLAKAIHNEYKSV